MDAEPGIQRPSPVAGGALAALLIGFPALYVLNSVMPWSVEFTLRGNHDYYVPFLVSLMALHWASAFLAWQVARRHGRGLASLGLGLAPSRAVGLVAGLLLLACLAVLVRELVPGQEALIRIPPAGLQLADRLERAWWIPFTFTAAFCEELVYRGFAITALRDRGHSRARAVVLATGAWCLVHGVGGILIFPAYFVAGLGFSALFLWRRSLVPVMVVHFLVVLSVVAS